MTTDNSKTDVVPFQQALIRIKPSARFGGIGLFAIRNLHRGTIIAKWEDLNEDLFFTWRDFEGIDDESREMIIDFCAQNEDGFWAPRNINLISLPWHMNHCCDGNAGFNLKGDFMTIGDIAKDEELTYDYGLLMTNPKYKLVCKCGSTNCRKIITGIDWRDPEYQKKNFDYMTLEIREMIDSEQRD